MRLFRRRADPSLDAWSELTRPTRVLTRDDTSYAIIMRELHNLESTGDDFFRNVSRDTARLYHIHPSELDR